MADHAVARPAGSLSSRLTTAALVESVEGEGSFCCGARSSASDSGSGFIAPMSSLGGLVGGIAGWPLSSHDLIHATMMPCATTIAGAAKMIEVMAIPEPVRPIRGPSPPQVMMAVIAVKEQLAKREHGYSSQG